MSMFPTHDTGIGFHGERFQTAATEDLSVCIIHQTITGHGGFIVQIKAVSILHDELTGTHQTKTGTDLVTEFGLDLIKVDGKLTIAADFSGSQSRHDLFMRRAQYPFTFTVVIDFEKGVARGIIATALLPYFRWLQCRHQYFQGTGAIHFFADDLLDFTQRAHAQRHKIIKSRGEFTNDARAEQKLMRKNLCLSRGFTECRYQ